MTNEIVLDLETQNSFTDVGGRDNLAALKVSVCGIYSYQTDKFSIFRENELGVLEEILKGADRIIGFNIKNFDFPVLQPYINIELRGLKCLDILDQIRRSCGRRISLDNIAQATLGKGKIADGLDAIKFFRQNRFDLLEEYCLDDVRITKEVYEYGKKHGRVASINPAIEIAATWSSDTAIEDKIQEAFKTNKRAIIKYSNGQFIMPHKRKIEIYHIDDDLIATYCHLKQDLRTFRISKIMDVQLTDEAYVVPDNFDVDKWRQDLKNKSEMGFKRIKGANSNR